MTVSVQKTAAEWQATLSSEQYRVCRQCGTEPAFTGAYWNCHDDGIYHCVCCSAPLFDANSKFDSGSGWPSFFQPYDAASLNVRTDTSYGMVREEVLCKNCAAHLGHVFPDGPTPTGLRYCINSASLTLKKK